MKFKTLIAATLLAGGAPLFAQNATVEVAAGAIVYDTQGAEVGRVDKVDGGIAVVNTGKNSASVPVTGIGRNEKGLLLLMTREQLDAAVEAATAKARGAVDQALVAGAAVRSSDGVALGMIKTISPEGVVTIDNAGKVFALKKDAFAVDATGSLAISATAAQINAAVAAQGAASPAPAKNEAAR